MTNECKTETNLKEFHSGDCIDFFIKGIAMKNIKTRYIKTAMNNIAWRIRTDLVMSVAFIKREIGGRALFH